MIVFVDGENFRQNLTKELMRKHLIKNQDTMYKYDVVGLMQEALKTDDVEVRYYASEVRMPKDYEPDPEIVEQMQKIERKAKRWTLMLEEQNVKYIRAGNLKPKMARPCRHCGKQEEIIQEKGVDVRLALDIFEQCLEPDCDEIAVMSSDVDLCPVYQKAHRHWTKVRYVCFADRMNRAVNSSCYRTMTISPAMVKNHFEGVMVGGESEIAEGTLVTDDYVDEN